MRKVTLAAMIAVVLSKKFETESQTKTAQPSEHPRKPAPRCLGMDCVCGGDCPDMKKEQSHVQ